MLIVHTGDGKGKTTAALGLALRAFGAGMRILILQFIKSRQDCGESIVINSLQKVSPDKIKFMQCGAGFITKENFSEQKILAQKTLQLAEKEILSDNWDMIILDEINYAVKFNLITEAEMLELIKKIPDNLHVVCTGRNATDKLIEAADLVTEMRLIKHPYQKGIIAQRGIEF